MAKEPKKKKTTKAGTNSEETNEIQDGIAKNSLDKVFEVLNESYEQEKKRLHSLSQQLKDNYIKAKRAECEVLHNKIVTVISEARPSPINLLFVLEILKQEALEQSMKLFFNPVPAPSKDKTEGKKE